MVLLHTVLCWASCFVHLKLLSPHETLCLFSYFCKLHLQPLKAEEILWEEAILVTISFLHTTQKQIVLTIELWICFSWTSQILKWSHCFKTSNRHFNGIIIILLTVVWGFFKIINGKDTETIQGSRSINSQGCCEILKPNKLLFSFLTVSCAYPIVYLGNCMTWEQR